MLALPPGPPLTVLAATAVATTVVSTTVACGLAAELDEACFSDLK